MPTQFKYITNTYLNDFVFIEMFIIDKRCQS